MFLSGTEAKQPCEEPLTNPCANRLQKGRADELQIPIIDPSDTESSWDGSYLPLTALEELQQALNTMQTRYFAIWLGVWSSTIDWTGAVMGTYVAAALNSLTRSFHYLIPFLSTSDSSPGKTESQLGAGRWRVENEINRYFTQSAEYYFGQNDFAIRLQANDDMLWVVLAWLENIKFVDVHAGVHYRPPIERGANTHSAEAWYGEQFVPAFAHRARIFWQLARRGWDTTLCGGGMLWNNHILPYKNAITNELYISASIGMYLYFPGDSNRSPFFLRNGPETRRFPFGFEQETPTPVGNSSYDTLHLSEAIKAYDWLKASNMTNNAGLYVDGFHIRDYGVNGTIGTGKCDERNDMVYTYNQGVLLSALRGLWEATGNVTYLEDGHRLVRNVIASTGWNLFSKPHIPPPSDLVERWKWRGLGRAGVLEDACDANGHCSQDGQTFKGIFFHHMTLFCEPLPASAKTPGKTHGAGKDRRTMHRQRCKEYAGWVAWNAKAALNTRDEKGVFGMWWSLGAVTDDSPVSQVYDLIEEKSQRLPETASDRAFNVLPPRHCESDQLWGKWCEDPNGRGRGRTVETQGGGVAVLRAMWEIGSM